MRTHDYTRQDVKRLADRMQKRLARSGLSVDFPTMLETVAAGFEARNWNTLSGKLREDPRSMTDDSSSHDSGFPVDRRAWSFDARFGIKINGVTPVSNDDMMTHQEFIIGVPGAGKSTVAHLDSLGFCLQEESRGRLPRLGVVDFYNGSSGLLDLLRNLRPIERRQEVAFIRMDARSMAWVVNPFDLPLGARMPGDFQHSTLVNLVRLLTAGIERNAGLRKVISAAVHDVYAACSEGSTHVKPYVAGVDPLVDQALGQRRVGVTMNRSWWDVSDSLFKAGDLANAERAQRYAVPLLKDLIAICAGSELWKRFGSTTLADGEPLPAVVTRHLVHACKQYPWLSVSTAVDLHKARIVLVDITDLAPCGSGQEQRQTEIAHLLAQIIVMRATGTLACDVDVKPDYQGHHQQQRECGSVRLVFEEIYRVSDADALRDQIMLLLAHGADNGIGVAMTTQMPSDLTAPMLQAATLVRVGGCVIQAGDRFFERAEAPQDVARFVSERFYGPFERDGSNFMTRSGPVGARTWRIERLFLEPWLQWALSANLQTVNVRDAVTARLGHVEALFRLANRFPRGVEFSGFYERMRRKDLSHDKAILEIVDEICATA